MTPRSARSLAPFVAILDASLTELGHACAPTGHTLVAWVLAEG